MGNMLYVREEQVTTTASGGAGIATDQIRVLNTEVINTISGASLATNQVTLPVGTYDIHGIAPAFDTEGNRAFLYNVTDAAIELLGASGPVLDASAITNESLPAEVFGRITIDAEKTLELRHYTQLSQTVNGLGIDVSDGRTEIYGQLLIREVSAVSVDGAGGIGGVVYQKLLLGL